MKHYKKHKSVDLRDIDPEEVNKNIDVSRSQNQQAQDRAKGTILGEEHRPEGAKNKGTPRHKHGSHAEGEYTKQSDNPTMHPSNMDDEE